MKNLCPACAVAKLIRDVREAGGLHTLLFRRMTRAIERAAASVEKAALAARERGPVVLESAVSCSDRIALRSSASVDLGSGPHGGNSAGASKETPLFSLRIQIVRSPSATETPNE